MHSVIGFVEFQAADLGVPTPRKALRGPANLKLLAYW